MTDDEIERNQRAFDALLPGLLDTDRGRHALMRHGKIVACFDAADAACAAALRRYPDSAFSVHEVCPPTVPAGPP